MKFTSYEKKMQLRFYGFFDFESKGVAVDKPCACGALEAPCTKHKTKTINKQEAFAFSLIIIDSRKGEIQDQIYYTGEDASDIFVKTLIDIDEKYAEIMGKIEPINMSEEEEAQY